MRYLRALVSFGFAALSSGIGSCQRPDNCWLSGLSTIPIWKCFPLETILMNS